MPDVADDDECEDKRNDDAGASGDGSDVAPENEDAHMRAAQRASRSSARARGPIDAPWRKKN